MNDKQTVEQTLEKIIQTNSLIQIVLSKNRLNLKNSKTIIRPLQIDNQLLYQITEHQESKAIHKNVSPSLCLEWLKNHLYQYKQVFFYTQSADYHLLVGKKENVTFLKKPPSKSTLKLTHNREKNYLLNEGEPIPFLVHLGVMNKEGKVHSSKRDKFRQINRFVEIIADIVPELDQKNRIHIIDFGCGKAYLTFALYHYLKISKGYSIHITGLDLKEDVIQHCQKLTKELGYDHDLQFIHGDIKDFEASKSVDLMISLHACDIATDLALEKAIHWKSKVILCVPCCQHELYSQVNQEALNPLLKHGILKERFASLVTDAARAQILEIKGYKTQVMEFIDLEHTPKNILIKAIKKSDLENHEALKSYLGLRNHLSIHPFLEKILKL
ncbi:MAG: SAM-dependent methyltransferase [Parachlamydiaceae bacterium]|nr:SAM-dependent methyltransferase [Parachlamydiaceae bacterium]